MKPEYDPIENPLGKHDFDAAVEQAEEMRKRISTEIFEGHRGSVCRVALAMLATEMAQASPHGVATEMRMLSNAINECCRDRGVTGQAIQESSHDDEASALTRRILQAICGAHPENLFHCLIGLLGGVYETAPEQIKPRLKQRISDTLASDMRPEKPPSGDN